MSKPKVCPWREKRNKVEQRENNSQKAGIKIGEKLRIVDMEKGERYRKKTNNKQSNSRIVLSHENLIKKPSCKIGKKRCAFMVQR